MSLPVVKASFIQAREHATVDIVSIFGPGKPHHLAFCTSMSGHVLGCRAAGLFDRNQIKAMNYTEKSLHFSMLLSPAHPSPMKSSSLISICGVADGLHFDN